MTSTGHAEATGATAQLRHEHEIFLRALGLLESIGLDLEAGRPLNRAALTWLLDFFRTVVDRCHHGKEEQHLFPALERRGMPRQGGPVAVMLNEHEQGRALLRRMGQGDDRRTAGAIREYAGLLRAHIDKENSVLFPMAEQMLTGEEQHALAEAFEALERDVVGPGIHERLLSELDRLEGAAEPSVLDVRAMSPRERHPKIFETFDHLGKGQTFILVNDHDPKPLYYQFQAEKVGQFTWDYQEQGPEVWRVRIGRV